MRAAFLIATGTQYHVMSFDITQCHDRTVPKLSQTIAQATEQQPTFRSEHALRESATEKEREMIVARRRLSHVRTLPYRRLLEIVVQSVLLLVGRLATQSQISEHPLKQCRRTRSKSQPKIPDQLHIERLWIRCDGVFGIQ